MNTSLVVMMPEQHQPQLAALAQLLQLPLLACDDRFDKGQYALTMEQGVLGVKALGSKAGMVAVDFESGTAAHRRKQGGGELIVKAMGGSKQNRPKVLDATAGLGRDSFVLASWGFPVSMIERSNVVASLLEDGLKRAQHSDSDEVRSIASRMSLYSGQAVEYLDSLLADDCPDVIYLDPMFPDSKKSALVKKDMQAFHALVGKEADDGTELLAAALTKAVYRVVVKRPKKAPFLGDQKPNHSLEGKAVRFDIYTLKSFAK